MKEQIEHIAKVIHDSDIADINTFPISMSDCLGKHGARRTGAAIALVKAGYRKQNYGEYHGSRFTDGAFYQEQCSVCGEWTYDYDKNYCPECGAKMKGDAK